MPKVLAKLLAASLLFAATALPATTAATGQPAPDFALKNLAGNNLRLSEWRGEVVLLTFWAEWCGRCTAQLQALEALQLQHQGDGVRIVAVNIDREAQPFRDASSRLKLLVLHDSDQSVARQYELSDLPLTVLVDAHGAVRYVHEKYRGGDAALYAEELTALLVE